MTRRVSQKRIDSLRQQVHEQRAWVEKCGGDLAGYIAHYGDPGIPPLDEDGNPKVISVKPGDERLLLGRSEPVPDRPGCFYAPYHGNGGTAIYKADHDRLVGLEAEFESLTGHSA